MKRGKAGGFLTACRAEGGPRASAQTDPAALVTRHVLVELQWQGRGGTFHHIALTSRDVRRVLGRSGMVLVLTLAIVSGFFAVLNRTPGPHGVEAVLRENMELKARQEVMRERAFDLADQLYWHFDEERRMARLADTAGHAWVAECLPPPARDAGDEALLAWLSEQGMRLEALGNTLTASRVEMRAQQASAPATVNGNRVSARGEPALHPADMEPARGYAAAAATR